MEAVSVDFGEPPFALVERLAVLMLLWLMFRCEDDLDADERRGFARGASPFLSSAGALAPFFSILARGFVLVDATAFPGSGCCFPECCSCADD